ncbi:MAG: hypothetical protein K8R36_24820 [Planctomycetales bacterium]|nr:hypothetical protein [Planctomycetales bacterium]
MKFTIRDLFLVIVIAAILLAWWRDRSSLDLDKRIYESDAHYLSGFFNIDSDAWTDERLKELVLKYHLEYRTTAKPSVLPNSKAPTPNTRKK